MKRLAKRQINEIIQLYNYGNAPTKIAEKFAILPSSVNRIIRNSGGQSNHAPTKVTIDQEKMIIDRYIAGESSEIIAKDLNIHPTTACRVLKRNNVKLRPPAENKKKYKANNDIAVFDITKENDVINYWFKYFRANGFPYPNYADEKLIEDWNKLKALDTTTIENNKILTPYKPAGLKLFKQFNKQFYEVSGHSKLSMVDAFRNDDILVKVIQNRLEQGFRLSDNMLVQGLRNGYFAFASSIFVPSVAKYIYEKYCKNGDIVYDYSFGFGQRMLAALSTNKNLKYIGVDPYSRNIESAVDTIKFISKYENIENRVGLINAGAEEYIGDKVDIAFSSPPYFDKEIYTNETTQAYCNGYDAFLKWWSKVCRNISVMLKGDGYFILNMENELLNDMLAICNDNGFVEVDRYYIKLSRNTRFRNKGAIKLEPIVVMKKVQ
jgi:tRNA1(Val) A37 N6-methylase TrmN6